MSRLNDIELQVTELIIERCKLDDVVATEVDFDAPIFVSQDEDGSENGLELDSVDALEIVAAVKGAFGVSIDPKDMGVFHSIRTLSEYIISKTQEAVAV